MAEHNGEVHLRVDAGIAAIVIDRPEARNAMTWAMYESLARICETIRADATIKVVTMRGAGGAAFVAGTDIEQFRNFDAEAGIAYERTIDERIDQIESLPVPTICIIEGWAIGGGMAIASACDFRVATPDASFGVPIARTLGNCLSIANTARVVAAFGLPRAKKLLMLGETIGAEEAQACGYLTQIAAPEELDATVARLCGRLAANAPLTMRAGKEAMRRLLHAGLPEGDDLIRSCYGSRDFQLGVEAFFDKKRAQWTGA